MLTADSSLLQMNATPLVNTNDPVGLKTEVLTQESDQFEKDVTEQKCKMCDFWCRTRDDMVKHLRIRHGIFDEVCINWISL